MNKALQKWAERKVEILKRWSEEYHELCVKQGLKEEPIVSIAFDGEYIGSISTKIEDKNGMDVYLFNTECLFLNNGKWS